MNAKLCKMAPHQVQAIHFNATLLQEGLDAALTGVSLLPGPGAAVSAALSKIVDQPGAVEALADWLNSFSNPTVPAPAVPAPVSPAS